MSFQFSLGKAQLKHFKTSLQTLGKIGAELLIEAFPEKVKPRERKQQIENNVAETETVRRNQRPCLTQFVLRSINSAKSAFLAVTFYSRFFESYEVFGNEVIQSAVLTKVRKGAGIAAPRFAGRNHRLSHSQATTPDPLPTTRHAPSRPECPGHLPLSEGAADILCAGHQHDAPEGHRTDRGG